MRFTCNIESQKILMIKDETFVNEIFQIFEQAYKLQIPGGSKNVPLDKMQFLDHRYRFFNQNFRIIAEEVFSNT